VLVHAVCDAILGAIGAGDLGKHFPDTDAAYDNIESMVLLKKIVQKAKAKGFRIVNMDATVTAKEPRLAEYIPRMREKLCEVLEVGTEGVNIKAMNPEGLGFCGRGEGIMAQTVVLMEGRIRKDTDAENL
jgi:2-C-methyl-D-erythritol 2,4-cyclodiphosphate synthase